MSPSKAEIAAAAISHGVRCLVIPVAATNDEPPRTASTRPLGVNPGLPIREFPNDFASGGAPRHRNCKVNLDDLDWDRPDLDCKASKRWASLAIFAWTRQRPPDPPAGDGFEVSYVLDDGAEHRVPITQAASSST